MRTDLSNLLDLEPHPEGGWFRETYRAATVVSTSDGRERSTATLIHFHLPAGEASAWHRVVSDEVWLAHIGAVTLELGGSGPRPEPGDQVTVGVDVAAGERLQVLVPAGVWQRTVPADGEALVSCLVSPGFHFDDFELLDPPTTR